MNCFIICIVLLIICIFLKGAGHTSSTHHTHTHTETHLVLINSNCLKHYPVPFAFVRISKYTKPTCYPNTIQFIIVDTVGFQTIPCQPIQFHIWNDLKVFYRNLNLKLKNSMRNSKSQTKHQIRKFKQLFCSNFIIFRNQNVQFWIVCRNYSPTITKHWNIVMNYEICAIVFEF